MQISKISFLPNISNNQIKANQQNIKPASSQIKEINLNLSPAFMGRIHNFEPVDEKIFLQKGGKLFFDKAKTGNNTPYSGKMINDSKNMRVVSNYQSGEKTSINIMWSPNDDRGYISRQLKKDEVINHSDKSKTIIWASETNDFEYAENYNPNGKLSKTNLIGYKSMFDNTVVMTIEREFEPDGTTLYREETNIADDFKDTFGYSRRISYNNKKGYEDVYFNVTSKDKTRTASRRTVYTNNQGVRYRTCENDVTYYDKNTSNECAKSDKRIVFKDKTGKTIIRDEGYRTTDTTHGIAPFKNILYKEHPATVRDIKGNVHIYYDGMTHKRYALEEYENGKTLPSCIINFDKKFGAEINELGKNAISVKIYANYEKLSSAMLITRKNDNYIIKQIDLFDPKTEKRTATRRVYDDGTIQTNYYDSNGQLISSKSESEGSTGGKI